MVFFLNLLYTLFFSYLIGAKYRGYKLTDSAFYFCLFYIGLVWIIISGGQYNVGTDYPIYIEIFKGETIAHYHRTGEIVFYSFVVFLNSLGIKGQSIYYIFYIINFFFLLLIIKRFKINHIFLFFLLYIAYCNVFNNQLNIVRQITAIHICTYATILFCEGKNKLFFILVFFATGIHLSSFIFLGLYIIKRFYNLRGVYLNLILCTCFIGSFYFTSGVFTIISDYLPPMYAYHLTKDTLNIDSLLTSITKYMFIPLFCCSTSLLKLSLTDFERKLFIIGFLGFCFRILVVQVSIINRLGDNFILLTSFPLFFYLRYLRKENKWILFYIIIIGLIAFYGLKTLIFPSAEYIYNSIYFLNT